ncbi:hypothetical protein BHE74_00010248 [Ensete ventricosum]|uniref:Uncharacterized protein n=1 Tax=Ensete ventricosum TaxID=4639 RepID=A0A445M9C3_ENSVE|nr:hypothetical protein BHE74_00010248 [Ensete ventricosum]RZR70843.1 hypothetical protein BHM03_00001855 [Ensete ventricosum]
MCGTHSHSCHSEERRPHTCGTLQTESPTRLPCEGERGGENSGGRCRRRDASEGKGFAGFAIDFLMVGVSAAVSKTAASPIQLKTWSRTRCSSPVPPRYLSPIGEESLARSVLLPVRGGTRRRANILHAIAGAGVLAGCNKLQLLIFGKKYGSGCA